MSFNFNVLNKNAMQRHVDELVSINASNLKNEYWEASHFLADLDMKWKLSFYVSTEEGKIAGFLIASDKIQTVHIHKYVVDHPFQNQGLGSKMLNHLLAQTDKPISLKVERDNAKALQFYLKKGFRVTGDENNLHTMIFRR